MVGLIIDIILYSLFSKYEDDGRGSDTVFIPFEGNGTNKQENTPPQDKTDYYPDEFDEFGEF